MAKYSIELKWALIFTLMTLGWMLAEELGGLHDKYIDYQMYLTNLFIIPAIWMMVLALKDKKRNYYAGLMSYTQGLWSGTIISGIVALLSPVTMWITLYVIAPEYFPNVIRRSVALGFYRTHAEAAAMFNYRNYVIQNAVFSVITGFITTAIVMLLLRTRKR